MRHSATSEERFARSRHLAALLLVAFLALPTAAFASGKRALPGPAGTGRVMLPNGWYLTPAGRQVGVGDLPLGLAVSPDERFAAVTHSGWKGRGLDIVDLAAGKHVQTISLRETWLGVAFLDDGKMLAVSAAGENRVLLYTMADGRASLADSIVIGPRWSAGGQYPQGKKIDYGPGAIWTTGLSADAGRKRLYVVSQLDSALNVLDVTARRMQRRVSLGAVPYTCLVSRDGARIFVSLWSSASLAIVDAASLGITRVIPVGDHPTDLVESRDGSRVFVANSNVNTVAVVDVAAGRAVEMLRTSRTPDEPAGDMPNGLTLDAKGERLYVANAGANHVAVFDVNQPGRSQAVGFLPTGWYPTAVRFLPRSRTLIVANGKGAGSSPSKDVVPDTSRWCRYLQCSPNA